MLPGLAGPLVASILGQTSSMMSWASASLNLPAHGASKTAPTFFSVLRQARTCGELFLLVIES
eukprot:13464733-Heterocapsa_arctica.AAC.1